MKIFHKYHTYTTNVSQKLFSFFFLEKFEKKVIKKMITLCNIKINVINLHVNYKPFQQ